jgi:tRNA(Ile2) C34 agmatinyltransferase TiaS
MFTNKQDISKSLKARRTDICKTCPHSHYLLGRFRCKKCGCFIEIKSRVKKAKCPIGLWESDVDNKK